MTMHLAQMNVGHLRAPTDSPELADFMAGLEPINALAESSPGFVWRLKGGDDPQDTVQHDYGDHLLINFSVWESRETLWDFAYRTVHLEFLRRRREWFLRMAEPYTVMWWIPAGYVPTLEEGMERLALLRGEGPTPAAFTFKDFHEAPGPAGDLHDAPEPAGGRR
ncbi:DUF3291 domain-containing protein [Streptosporangium pseudovulgare]|uniref:DUF3291 domain-containing protein n=1 Tax=Streptosporangium pseudovulgare TaxID=35765 RepID=A0ABQ2R5W5_9ACTN|nr:DUF3291 domain-containing protein [Streptosporangium pseudovulgare]GGQ15372.1 hypothetical protein GCM10010140_52010 [Streptosporangium pseudovulgare]